MATTYKVAVFSLDGTTFLRNVKLTVPLARANGTGTTGVQINTSENLGDILAAMNTSASSTVYFEPSANIFVGPGRDNLDNAFMAQYGLSPIEPLAFATTAGVRLVFNNGSYMTFIPEEAVSNVRFTVAYYLSDGTSLGSGLVNAGYRNIEHNNYEAQCGTLPMPLFNIDGTMTDFKPRYAYVGVERWSRYGNIRYLCMGRTWDNLGTFNIDLTTWFDGIVPIDPDDPYPGIEDSGPSGPAEGAGIPETAGIDIPPLPSVSILDTGFINLFNPTLAQVRSLADYMWSAGFDLATFKKLFADPMECILGFNLVPVDVPSGSPATIMVGNIATTVSMNVATSQWVELDCGSVDIDKAYGNYLDYAPYSKFSLYLPYIGTVELSTDDLVGRTLRLVYHVDVLGCSCVAYLKCGPDVLYQFTGSCGYSVPLTGQNFREMVGAVIDMAVNLGGVMAGGNAVSGVGAIAKDVMNLKPTIHRSGSIGASAGIMGVQVPYLIMELPRACKPAKQYHYLGYPSFTTVNLGELSGRQDFESVILDGIPCTEEEREMIAASCAGGIYL